jgi:hypothetical protein
MRRIVLAVAVLSAACSNGGMVPPTSGATTVATTASPATVGTTQAAGPDAAACPGFGESMVLGEIDGTDLDEISGLATGRSDVRVLWAHEDSGGGPVLWKLSREGEVLARIEVGGAEAVDWEDLAIGPGPGGDHLYLADTGDNTRQRESVTLYRFPEPGPGDRTVTARALEVVYPDGPRDVEAVLVDPADGAAYLIDKRFGTSAGIYRVPAVAWDGARVEAVRVGTLSAGLLAPVTAADISPDGSRVVVRTYRSVLLFSRPAGTALADALAGPWCAGPVPPEVQGEAIAWADDGYLTVAEGAGAAIYSVPGR